MWVFNLKFAFCSRGFLFGATFGKDEENEVMGAPVGVKFSFMMLILKRVVVVLGGSALAC